eukprot:824267_1
MTSFAESWICISCGTTNNRNRNGNPCTNCHILESDTNLKRARELYILGNIKSESVRLLPLKTPFFIYPLSAPEVQYHVEYKEDYEMLIHFEVELWDEKRIEFYHIEAIKVDVESRSIPNIIVQNTTPYNNTFIYNFIEFESGFQTFDIYTKCAQSTHVSPKRTVAIFISSPSIMNTPSENTHNKKTLHLESTATETHNRKKVEVPNTTANIAAKQQPRSRKSPNKNQPQKLWQKKPTSKSTPTDTHNTKHVSNISTLEPVRWYFMNDYGKRMRIYDGLSKDINEMKTGTNKTVTYRSKTYYIRKITSTECTQRNLKTNKVRRLTTDHYKASNHDSTPSDMIWYFVNKDGQSIQISKTISDTINAMKTGQYKNKHKGFRLYKTTHDRCLQIDNGTNECRILRPNIGTSFQTTSKQSQQTNDDYKADDNDQANTFVPRCLTYQEAVQLKIGKRVDIRCGTNGYVYRGKVMYRETIDTEIQITIGYQGSDHEDEINIDKAYHNELHRLAKYKLISNRAGHRFKNTKNIDINPIYLDPGWRPGTIINACKGQIQVSFRHSVSKQIRKYWVHPDNSNECAEFGTGRIDMEQVKALFHSTVSPDKFRIIDIKDVSKSNANTRNIYESILKSKEKPLHQIEKYLWHGTRGSANDDVLDLILKNGFDRSYNKKGRYGSGTYFARDASYPVGRGFCGKDKSKTNARFILLCRVIVGEYTMGNKNIKTIPKKKDGKEYESLVNSTSDPTIFVSWRDYHAIPYYLIRFRLKCLS